MTEALSKKAEVTGKDAIIAAAADCFRVSGFSATSIDDVARSLGATKGMVYHYYRSKVELFFDVHRVGMAINLNSIEPIVSDTGSPRDKLERMTKVHLSNMLNWFSYQRVQMQGVEMHLSSPTTPEQREKLQMLMDERERYEGLFRSVLLEGREQGEFEFSNPSFASKAFLAILNNPVLWYKEPATEDEAGKASIIDEFSRFAINSILAKDSGGDAK